MIKRVTKQLESQGLGLELTEAAKAFLADRGYDPHARGPAAAPGHPAPGRGLALRAAALEGVPRRRDDHRRRRGRSRVAQRREGHHLPVDRGLPAPGGRDGRGRPDRVARRPRSRYTFQLAYILAGVTKHLVDIDDDTLGAARAELGTATLKETVNEALRLAASPRDERVSARRRARQRGSRRTRRRVALTYLVDTSVLKRLAVPAVRATVEPLAAAGRLARAGISDLEVGYSARNGREWDRLVGALEIFALVETTADHVRRASQVQRHLASKSQRGRKVPDLLDSRGRRGRST